MLNLQAYDIEQPNTTHQQIMELQNETRELKKDIQDLQCRIAVANVLILLGFIIHLLNSNGGTY